MLNYSLRYYGGVKVIDLDGGLSSNSVETFMAFVQRLTDKESVMVNLENVSFVSSAGLASMLDVSFYAKEQENRVIFLWPSEELIQMAEDMEVYSHLIFANSVEEGQTKIQYFT